MSEEKKKASFFAKIFGKKSTEEEIPEKSGDSFLNELIELSANSDLTDTGSEEEERDTEDLLMNELSDSTVSTADSDGDESESESESNVSQSEMDALLEEMFSDCIKSKAESSGKDGVTDTIRRIRTAAEEEDLEIPEELLLRMDEYSSTGGADHEVTENAEETDADELADGISEVFSGTETEVGKGSVPEDNGGESGNEDVIDSKLRELFRVGNEETDNTASDDAGDEEDTETVETVEYDNVSASEDDGFSAGDEEVDIDMSSIADDIGKMNVEDAILMEALGYDGKTGSEIRRTPTHVDVEKDAVRTSDMDDAFAFSGREYHSRSERDDIRSAYASEKLKIRVRLCGTALLAVLLFVYDVFGKKFGGAFSASQFPVVNILIGLQILLIAGAFSYKQIFSGIKGIFNTHPTIHSVTSVVVIFTVIYDIILAVIGQSVFTLYNFPAALCLLFTVFSDWLRLDREIRTFDKVSSWNGVCTLERVDSVSLARELGEGDVGASGNGVGRAYKLLHGKMPENYFHRINRRNPMMKVMNYVIAPVVALALVIFIISLAANRTLVDSLNIFIVLIQFGLPAFMVVAAVFPFYNLTSKKLDDSGVILNEVDTRDYATVDALVFDESDLFGSNALTVSRLTMCGNGEAGDIYDVLAGSATILGKMGGTIANALRDATPDTAAADAAELVEKSDNGVIGRFGGKEYVIGTEKFLADAGIAVSGYFDKEFMSATPGGAVLHIAVDGREALKLNLTYRINPGFVGMAQELSERNIRMILRCTDPCVDDRLLGTLVGELSSPITILKNVEAGTSGDGDTVDGGILADSEEWSSVMRAADACSLFRKWSAFNLMLMGGIMALGILLAAFLGALGTVVGMSSLYVVLFQVLAILPTVAISKLWLD